MIIELVMLAVLGVLPGVAIALIVSLCGGFNNKAKPRGPKTLFGISKVLAGLVLIVHIYGLARGGEDAELASFYFPTYISLVVGISVTFWIYCKVKTGKKEDGRPRPQRRPWARVKATNCLLLLAIALVPFAVVTALSKLTGEPAKTVQGATGEAWKAENQARRPGKTHTQPQPLDISLDEIELYDCMLDSMGSMTGFIKNGSKAILQKVDAQVVVRNLRKDVIYQGDVVIRCAIPPGEARGFEHPGAVPARNLRLGFDRTFQWTWEVCIVSASGARVEREPDIFDQILSKPEE